MYAFATPKHTLCPAIILKVKHVEKNLAQDFNEVTQFYFVLKQNIKKFRLNTIAILLFIFTFSRVAYVSTLKLVYMRNQIIKMSCISYLESSDCIYTSPDGFIKETLPDGKSHGIEASMISFLWRGLKEQTYFCR